MGSTGIPGTSHQTMQPRLYGKPAGVYHYSRKKKRLNGFVKWSFCFILLLSMFFAGFRYAPFPPFEQLRNLWVTTAMTTLNHQYLAKWFFSDEEIQKILADNQAKNLGNSNPNAISTLGTSNNKGIELININQKGFKGYLLKIKDPSRVKVAGTQYLGSRGEKAEEIAKETGAAAVINGGAFSDPQGNGSGGTPLGILISGGNILHKDAISSYDVIGFNRNNVLVLGHYTLAQIKQMGIRDAVSFDPFLVVNGKPSITQGDGGWGLAPRTAIGQTRDGTVLMLVIDGRQVSSVGATLKDVQDIMLNYGAYNVANLDGGASTVLYYNQQMVNHPSSQYGDRHLPSFFIVK